MTRCRLLTVCRQGWSIEIGMEHRNQRSETNEKDQTHCFAAAGNLLTVTDRWALFRIITSQIYSRDTVQPLIGVAPSGAITREEISSLGDTIPRNHDGTDGVVESTNEYRKSDCAGIVWRGLREVSRKTPTHVCHRSVIVRGRAARAARRRVGPACAAVV